MLESVCKLCKSRVADQRNSHIIPKFLTKELFQVESPRHAISLDSKGQEKKIQDTPKEDHILCSYCEKRISIVEISLTHFFRDIKRYSALPDKFSIKKIGSQEYLECNSIHPTLYKLFIYSMIWRVSISSSFQQFSLSTEREEVLRLFLNTNLREKKFELLAILGAINEVPLWNNHFMMPKHLNNPFKGWFSAAKLSESFYLLLLANYGLYLITDESSMAKELAPFSNKQNSKVIVVLADNKAWEEMNMSYMHKILNLTT